MSDGVSMFDAHMCLVEWNARFPEIAGIPADILRVGLPMEEILRAQIKTGQFGWITDPEAEVERGGWRACASLPFGVEQRQRPDGHTLELRRNRLPDGGFVTLYADITGTQAGRGSPARGEGRRRKRRTPKNPASWRSSATRSGRR